VIITFITSGTLRSELTEKVYVYGILNS